MSDTLQKFLDYLSLKKLTLYPAQEEAILELYDGKNVILNTPTGSGKSLVAAAVHFDALARGVRSIYTCPIKALDNEKFLSLCKDFGADQVGMITGDGSVNPEDPIICCTAEILSNFALKLGEETPFAEVIMDEFHYYSDPERGIAWQIPLLTLKKSRFLLMSATLGDTQLFETALTELNQRPTVVIRSQDRPVPLEFEYSERPLHFKITDLIAAKKSPIYLVNFTQRECAETAQDLMSIDFCTKEEKKQISEHLEGVDFKSPYGKEMSKFLKHGLGLHHAGLLPRYRVLVEKLAQKGLLKIICGTDTLGVGVNVPIRTVLFSKLCKYDGHKTTLLSVRDFQQISGRAGRKGFDEQGTVVVQAPEHVIENLIQEQKAASDPKKAKKLIKRKPPEKGFVSWNTQTLTQLSTGTPEALTSRFKVTHAMILNVLGRNQTPDSKNHHALRDIIKRSHESTHQKKRHFKHAFQLFRSLVDRNIITLNPLQVNLDLQQDFSLNQSLSLFLIDTLSALDLNHPDYALNLLSLVESILENPDLILRRQVDRLKTIKMEEMKRAGMEYEERMEELEKIEHPKPNRDFIYNNFNEFTRLHPWVNQGGENETIRPKSVAREMFETFQSFHDYIRDYDLQRIEGLLLRYLTEVYKVLVQTVPESARTEEVISLIEYFREMLSQIDSSLLDEWEKIKNPELAMQKIKERNLEQELKEKAIQIEKTKKVIIKNEVMRALRLLANADFENASSLLNTEKTLLEQKMKIYFENHTQILMDQKARAPSLTRVKEIGTNHYELEQTLLDENADQDFTLKIEAKVESRVGVNSFKATLSFMDLGAT